MHRAPPVIMKLEAYRFSDMSLELMRSYFTEQKNRVKIKGVTSTWKEQLRGCPQGSSPGPLLWNIFQNDLSLNVRASNLPMYADDHLVYQSGSNITAVNSELTEMLIQGKSFPCQPEKISSFSNDTSKR